ncbi:MAG: DUF952 domain-containing protein [Chloroflexi bacterium]|jgi:uncharacterized protein (DUF952 family)|nr:DUF952 domain-containing protein [Anaerolineaceae bacterium]NMB89559.1 DUF952 domain-containing protein [Chloroflexota bacterium]
MVLLHITPLTDWQNAQKTGLYQADSLNTEGFIHCSTQEQIDGVAERFYRGRSGLVVLVIDQQRVEAEIRFENLEGGSQLFPHIYGPLNLDAVIEVRPFEG